MLPAILADAWRQYRRRPLALLVTLGVALLELGAGQLSGGGAVTLATAPASLAVIVVDLLSDLFLVAYLAGGLAAAPPPAAAALAALRRSLGPGLRAQLLWLAYWLAALLVADIMALSVLGPVDSGTPTAPQAVKLAVALVPLSGFAFAFLAVILQRVVLDGERRAAAAAMASHRVARAHFPICLLIGLAQALLMLGAHFNGLLAQAAAVLAAVMLSPYVIAASNALYLRTRELHQVAPERRGDRGSAR